MTEVAATPTKFSYQIRFFKPYESLTTEVAATQTKPACAGSLEKMGDESGFRITDTRIAIHGCSLFFTT